MKSAPGLDLFLFLKTRRNTWKFFHKCTNLNWLTFWEKKYEKQKHISEDNKKTQLANKLRAGAAAKK